MTIEDTCNTLLHLRMIQTDDPVNRPKPMPGQAIKVLKGRKNGIARKHLQRRETHDDDKLKGPFVAPTRYEIHWDPDEVALYLADMASKNYVTLKPEKLKWSPFIVSRTSKTEQLPTANSATAQALGAQAMIASDAVPAVVETPGPVADLRDLGAMHSESPFDLFNDDVVENVSSPPRDASRQPQGMDVDPSPSVPDGSLPPGSTHEPASETTAGSDPSPEETQTNEQTQLELDEAMARKLARDLQMSDRSLRRRSTNDAKSAEDARQRTQDESPTVRKSRPAAGRRTSVRVTANVSPVKAGSGARRASQGDRDEAAKRPLRSRTIEPDAARGATSARSVSPRKRRRVESPQPMEVDTATTPFRRSSRRGVTEEPTGRGQRRAPMRRNTDMPVRPPSPIKTRRSPRKPTSDAATFEAPYDAEGAGEQDVEMQDESVNSPLTGAASRHSVPSEVTLVVTPTAAGMNKGSPGGPVAMPPVLSAVDDGAYGGMDVDEDEKDDDYTADHEDEDAEGEPDEEGEPDLGEG